VAADCVPFHTLLKHIGPPCTPSFPPLHRTDGLLSVFRDLCYHVINFHEYPTGQSIADVPGPRVKSMSRHSGADALEPRG
jgi:hypothetical protein